MDLEEGFLEEVFRGGPIAHKTGQKPQQIIVVPLDELAIGARIPIAEGDEDLLVCLGAEIRQFFPLTPVAGVYDGGWGKDRLIRLMDCAERPFHSDPGLRPESCKPVRTQPGGGLGDIGLVGRD